MSSSARVSRRPGSGSKIARPRSRAASAGTERRAHAMFDDTIAAIATPLGEGGLAVIRVSGTRAFEIADRCFRASSKKAEPPSEAKSHTLHHGHIVRGD